MFSKKATKIREIFTSDLTLITFCQIDGEDFVNFLAFLENMNFKFIDITTWKVYEHYTINGEIKIIQLGFFSSVYQYRPIIKSTFLERRGNFQGYKMKAMTEEIGPYVYFDLCVDHVI